jgi:pentapeptide MXKDX repeat protein
MKRDAMRSDTMKRDAMRSDTRKRDAMNRVFTEVVWV